MSQQVHILTHNYSVVITTLLHETAPIFNLCLHYCLNYTPVKFGDWILYSCDAIMLTKSVHRLHNHFAK